MLLLLIFLSLPFGLGLILVFLISFASRVLIFLATIVFVISDSGLRGKSALRFLAVDATDAGTVAGERTPCRMSAAAAEARAAAYVDFMVNLCGREPARSARSVTAESAAHNLPGVMMSKLEVLHVLSPAEKASAAAAASPAPQELLSLLRLCFLCRCLASAIHPSNQSLICYRYCTSLWIISLIVTL